MKLIGAIFLSVILFASSATAQLINITNITRSSSLPTSASLLGISNDVTRLFPASVLVQTNESRAVVLTNQANIFGGSIIASQLRNLNFLGSRALVSGGDRSVAESATTSTEVGYLSGVSSSVQSQLNGKASSTHTHAAADTTSGTFGTARLGSGVASGTTLLHGNSSWSAVSLANDVSGDLGVSHLNGGASASSGTFWRGDGTWAPVGDALTSNPLIQFASGPMPIITGNSILTGTLNVGSNGFSPVGITLDVEGSSRIDGSLSVTGAVLVQGASLTLPSGNINASAGTVTANLFSGSGASLTSIPESGVTGLTGDLAGKQPTGNYVTALTGDVTANGPGSVSATLASVATPGTSTKVTYNAKGLVTSGTSLTAGDIPAIAESGVTGLTSDLASKASLGGNNIFTGNNESVGSFQFDLTTVFTNGLLAAGNINLGSTASVNSSNRLQIVNSLQQILMQVSTNGVIRNGTNNTFNVDSNGVMTAASITAVGSGLTGIPESGVTSLVSDLAGKQATGNYVTALTGDVTASGPGSVAATLATVATPGTSTKVTYNAKGLVTSGTTLSAGDIPAIPESGVTSLVSDLAGKQATGNYITALTGDITASGPGSASSTLASVATPGTSTKVTYNAKGLVTSGTTLSVSDIPSLTLSKISDAGSSASHAVTDFVSTNEARATVVVSLTNASNKIGGDGSLLTGVPFEIVGAQDGSAGFNTLNKFFSACYNQTRAVRFISITDLGTYGAIGSLFSSWTGYGGELGQGGGADGELQMDSAGSVTLVANNSPVWYLGLYSVGSGGTMTWRKRNASHGDTSIGGTNFWATKFQVRYVQETGAGTFKVQTNLNGGTWTDVTGGTVNANGSTNGGVLTLSFTAGYYSVRVVGTAGTVRVQDAGLWDDSVGKIVIGGFGIANTSPQGDVGLFSISGVTSTNTTAAKSYTNMTWQWFSAMAPDLMVLMDTSGIGTDEGFPQQLGTWQNMMTNACPGASQIWCGNHYVLGTEPALNNCIRTNAINYGVAYNDSYYDLGTNITQLIADGILQIDGVHPAIGKGTDYLNGSLYRRIMNAANILGFDFVDPTKFIYGSTVGLFNSGNTNPVTLGATPINANPLVVDNKRAKLRIVDGYGDFALGSLGTGALGLWMQSAASFDPSLDLTNATLLFDGTWLNIQGANAGTGSGGGIIFGTEMTPGNNGEGARLWPPTSPGGAWGGLSVGSKLDALAGDPGNGNIRAQNSISAGVNVTATANLTARHLVGSGTTPTAVTNVACGGGSVLTLDANAHDTAFQAKLVTGSSTTIGQIFHLTYGTAFATAPHVVWSHTSLIAGLLGGRVYTTNATTTGFDFMSGGTPMTSNTNYEWTFITVQ